MTNLLIDTCSWKQLISKNEISKELIQLKSWVKNGEVNLFCPEVLKEEWIKHRNIEIEAISKALNNQKKSLKLFNIPIADSQLELAKELLESQVSIVDELLKLSSFIPTSDSAKIRTTDHATKNKAPFHKKRESHNDALLIFSTLDYFDKNGLQEFNFLSDNYNDFTQSIDNGYKIHPDISKGYDKMSIRYFRKPQDLINAYISQKGLTSLKEDVDILPFSSSRVLAISQNCPIIDQLHEYVTKRYSEITFYPLHLLKLDFPFKVTSSFWSHYGLFTLHTDNTVLFGLFESLTLSEGNAISISNPLYTANVENPKDKIEAVLNKLNANLVFSIGNREQNKKIDIRHLDKKICNCVRCNFNRLNFHLALNDSNPEEGDDVNNLIKKAYVNYQFGSFIKSVEIYEKVAEWAEKNEKHTTLFLAKYNLSKLSIFIQNHYWGKNNNEELVNKLQEIDLEKIAKSTSTAENAKLIEWIVKGTFYTQTLLKIQSLVSELRDSYYLQTEGGFSSNSTIWNLINEFGSIDSFLNQNFIVYDSFSEFFEIFELFTESVIASHAIPESQGSKLSYMDDYILKRLVYYGNTDIIQKYLRRYSLKQIKYKSSSPEGETFLDICFNFFDGYSFVNQFNIFEESNHNFFWLKYNRIFSNILTLFGIVDSNNLSKNQFAKKLLSFLRDENVIKENNLSSVRTFLWNTKDDLSPEAKREFVDLMLTNKKYHNDDSFELVGSLLRSFETEGISSNIFTKIMELHFENSIDRRSRYDTSSIVYFYKASNQEQQLIIRDKIVRLLTNKFHRELYYRSIMYDLLEYTDDLFESFYIDSIPKANTTSFRNAFISKDEKRFESVNELINLCFKFKIDLGANKFDWIRELDPYYKWLENLHDFDYSGFKPYWIIEYNTSYYDEQFKNCSKLRTVLSSYLRTNKNPVILKKYFNIYGGE